MLKIIGPINEPCGTPFDKPNQSLYLSPNNGGQGCRLSERLQHVLHLMGGVISNV